jgi:hypothetical protein
MRRQIAHNEAKLPIENGAKHVGAIIGPGYTRIGIEALPFRLRRQNLRIPRIPSKHNPSAGCRHSRRSRPG